MISEDKIIFFVGIPGSSWSRVATLLQWSPIINSNVSDRNKDREYYITKGTSWPNLINHQGAFFGSEMEFGMKWEYPEERDTPLTKEAVLHDIESAFRSHDDTNYLVKSHSIALSLDWWIKTFPNSKFIFVVRDYEASMKWWLNGGGFDITYPSYSWYKDEDSMLHKAKLQDWNIRQFVDDNDLTLYNMTSGFLKNEMAISFDIDTRIEKHYRAINHMPPDLTKGVPLYDTSVAFYPHLEEW